MNTPDLQDQEFFEFWTGYVFAAGFTASTDDGDALFPACGEFIDYYDTDDILARIPEHDRERMLADCWEFWKKLIDSGLLTAGDDIGSAGCDFWYTRNGHGAGFWDGDWGDDGDELTAMAEEFGEVWIDWIVEGADA